MTKTIKAQVLRVLGEMIKSGEVLVKFQADGEAMYTLSETKTVKSAELFAKRSAAAHKAWKTRRKNAREYNVIDGVWDVARVAAKLHKKLTKNKRVAAAHKAWKTRRLSANKTLLRK